MDPTGVRGQQPRVGAGATRSLPPRVRGRRRGALALTLSGLRLRGETGPTGVTCRVVWWGDARPREVALAPGGRVRLVYEVVSAREAFDRYLADAKKLFLQFLDPIR